MAQAVDPKKHRRYGQGSLTEISPGVWRLRVLVGIDVLTRSPIQRSRTFRGTAAGAERAIVAFRSELTSAPTPEQNVSSRLLLNDVVRAHIAAWSGAPGTGRGYESQFRTHIEKGFGRIRVGSITAQLMRDYYKALADEKHLSASTIWNIYSLISGALRRAGREQGLRFDFNQLVTPPKPVAEKRALASDDEIVGIFATAALIGDQWPLLFRLAFATGMRRGELVALRWRSLDNQNRLNVAKAIADAKGGSIEKTPKSGHHRLVAIDLETVRRWNVARDAVIEWCTDSDIPFDDRRYVFAADPAGSRPRRPDRVTKIWSTIREDVGLNPDLEFRAIRNWHATVLDDELGFDLAKIGRRLGHSRSDSTSTGMTARYSLSDGKVDDQMAMGIEMRLGAIERHEHAMRLPLDDR